MNLNDVQEKTIREKRPPQLQNEWGVSISPIGDDPHDDPHSGGMKNLESIGFLPDVPP